MPRRLIHRHQPRHDIANWVGAAWGELLISTADFVAGLPGAPHLQPRCAPSRPVFVGKA